MNLTTNINCKFYAILNIITTVVVFNLDVTTSLRDVRVQIPHAVRRGEKAILKCLYDLEGDSLYSVKWYKGRREFYSFTPKETPAMKVFQFAGAGIKVDRSQSNESQLVLETVNAVTTGKYSCEVSADAPSFHTLIAAAEMEVVVVPSRDPIITGIRPRYKVGDILRGNCTSGHSRPGANITWYTNGYETNPIHIKHYKPVKDAREMETITSGIHFVVTPQHFIYGKLKIRCTAHIHDVYWKSTEKSVEENRHATKQAGNVNVVHTFSDDYFDMDDEENVIDRSDTYMTHIKGDVSSLNASGGSSTLHACLSCFWPRLTTLSLLLYYGVRQQLLQLFFGQKTINEKISNCLAFNGKMKRKTETVAATMAHNENCNKQNKDNTGQQRHKMETKELQMQQLQREVVPTDQQQLQYVQHSESKQQRPAISGPMFSEVATICYKDIKDDEEGGHEQQQQQQRNKMLLLRETFFQIKLINNKNEQLPQQQLQVSVQMTQRQQQHEHEQQQQQHYYNVQHQVARCNGPTSINENYNLTMTIQVATIFNANKRRSTTITTTPAVSTNSSYANIPVAQQASILLVVIWQLCDKQSLAIKHNLFRLQQQKQQSCYLSYPTKFQQIQSTTPTTTATTSTTTNSIINIFYPSNEINLHNFLRITATASNLLAETTTTAT
ncbi:uncharacterized protein [Musca autumnalis]|uniref:uncharacterized protein n=1 Tax=Musca autumnalis TaxID=221902 RepID=UPI003CF9C7BD